MSRRPTSSSNQSLSRRAFVTGAGALGGALALPRAAGAQQENPGPPVGPNDIVTLAAVGVGGRGLDNLRDLKDTGVRVVALCDCDERQALEAWKLFPDAKHYTDWRRMLDAEKTIDAVLVATPDHNHAIVSIAAMRRGKHVYCEKPLAHSIWEARRDGARGGRNGRGDADGDAGPRLRGHAPRGGGRPRPGRSARSRSCTSGPTGRRAGGRRGSRARPTRRRSRRELDWDVWLGPAPERPYNPAYVPFKWRGFWDFGTGAIGDMGIHNLDTAFWALGLGAPTCVPRSATARRGCSIRLSRRPRPSGASSKSNSRRAARSRR